LVKDAEKGEPFHPLTSLGMDGEEVSSMTFVLLDFAGE
jgi:hypothetical protein